MKNLIAMIALALLSFSCQPEKQVISKATDYEAFFEGQILAANDQTTEIDYWQNRLLSSPKSPSYLKQLAAAYSQQFRADGNINHIHQADSLYQMALLLSPFGKAGTYRSLAANAITRHEFSEANSYAELALKAGENRSASYYLIFDALMELGRFKEAKAALSYQQKPTDFNYLIRASKLADHEGDLDKAIALMEQAFEKKKGDPVLYQWGKSNLGDMYGHAGRIADAYQAYLAVLAVNRNHWRSWQGLAWINYAHDGNTTEAKRILKYVSTRSDDPQIKLMLAEIAEYEWDTEKAQELKEAYYLEASRPKYQGMHNKYLILLEAEDLNMKESAIVRAHAEQEKRPTPGMYDLLAWTYAQNGEYEKALKLATLFVEGETYEPDALYHLGMIYLLNGKDKEARPYLEEALESGFELGPLAVANIKKTLSE